MIKTKVTYLNKEIVVDEEEPSTIPELVAMFGEDAVVLNTIANLRYRNKYPRVYRRVSVELAKMGFPPKIKRTELAKDGTEKPIWQDDMEHIRSYLTTNPSHKAKLIELFTRIANEEPLHIKGERVSGGRIAQGALDAAHRYFAEGTEKVTEVCVKIEEMLPNYRIARDVEGLVTPETLARGIQTLQRHLLSQAKQTASSL